MHTSSPTSIFFPNNALPTADVQWGQMALLPEQLQFVRKVRRMESVHSQRIEEMSFVLQKHKNGLKVVSWLLRLSSVRFLSFFLEMTACCSQPLLETNNKIKATKRQKDSREVSSAVEGEDATVLCICLLFYRTASSNTKEAHGIHDKGAWYPCSVPDATKGVLLFAGV